MAQIRHLTHAPIVEALVNFDAVTPASFDVTRLRAAHGRVADDYPTIEDSLLFQAAVSFNATPGAAAASSTTSPPVVRGYLFKTADGRSIVQLRRDGFTFNRLAPYTNWDAIRPEVTRLWRLYASIAEPVVRRIDLRFINRIPIPSAGVDLETILQTPLSLPLGAPDLVTEVFSRVVVRDPANDVAAVVVTSIQPNPVPPGGDSQGSSLVIDIDAYRDVADTTLTEADLGRVLAALRELKNKLFFGSITEETAERFI